MGNVGVLRKGLQQILTPRGMELQYDFSANNQGGPPVIGGQGQMSALTQTPADTSGNFQYQAPTIDDKGTQRMGDIYGATGLNQRMDLTRTEVGAAPGTRMAQNQAQQQVFEQSGKAGQEAQRNREVLGNMFGGIGALVSLANAGASGQDAFSGGMGAMGAYQSTAGQIGATSRGAGEAAAKRAARKVAVASPTRTEQEDLTNYTAPPTPAPKLTPEQEQRERDKATMSAWGQDPQGKAATLGHYGPFADRRAEEDQSQALSMIGVQSPYQTNYDKQGNPLTDVQPSPTKIGVTGQPELRLYGEDGNELPSPKPEVAPATTNTEQEQTVEQTGTTIANELNTQGKLPGAPNPTDPTESGKIIDENIKAAKAQSGQEKSMADDGIGKMVGVIGSKRIVGVI